MKILFLHGWTSVPGGRKPTYLKSQGHDVLNPALPDEDFDESVRIAQAEFDRHAPDVIVGSSRGGAVAMHVQAGAKPLVLLCPAWRKWGTKTRVPFNTIILHSRADEVIPFENSEQLARDSQLPATALRETGNDHRLADDASLAAMLAACEQAVCPAPLVDVTVHYLQMTSRPEYSRPEPREDLAVIPAHRTSVRYYRFLYDAVGSPHHWLSRRKLSDPSLAELLNDPLVELYVLHVDGTPAGFAELDRRDPAAVEIVQFGLMPEYIGQGLGRWFLQWTIDTAWAHHPHRVWLHTCSLDHAAALPLYKAMGFASYEERRIRREL